VKQPYADCTFRFHKRSLHLLGRLDDLEREVNKVHAQPSRNDETRIEDRMIVVQRRIDERG
jgi:hypothetical protein